MFRVILATGKETLVDAEGFSIDHRTAILTFHDYVQDSWGNPVPLSVAAYAGGQWVSVGHVQVKKVEVND